MNEKSLEALKQYDIHVARVSRGRGGMLVDTDKGRKLFLECTHPDRYYNKEDIITRAVRNGGFSWVDGYMTNNEGGLFSLDEEGRKYILKDWFVGDECDVKNISDVSDAVRTLAHLHIVLNGIALNQIFGESQMVLAAQIPEEDADCQDKQHIVIGQNQPLDEVCVRHTRELKLAWNYLKNKHKKSRFEQEAYRNMGCFYNEAKAAQQLFERENVSERLAKANDEEELCHSSYNYHNIIFERGRVAVTNFDRVSKECQISDLYGFMRKILEKYDWDVQVGYKMINEYDKVKAMSQSDIDLLTALFSFPEKFWKIINYYFNSSKAWIPPKSIQKLEKVIEQNDKRRAFLATLSSEN